MDAFAVGYQPSVLALGGGPVRQPRKPRERCCHGSTIFEINNSFVADADAVRQRLL
jgi:hypothetical protein